MGQAFLGEAASFGAYYIHSHNQEDKIVLGPAHIPYKEEPNPCIEVTGVMRGMNLYL
jgi:hypothetical protein